MFKLVDSILPDIHDRPMDLILTENRLVRVRKAVLARGFGRRDAGGLNDLFRPAPRKTPCYYAFLTRTKRFSVRIRSMGRYVNVWEYTIHELTFKSQTADNCAQTRTRQERS